MRLSKRIVSSLVVTTILAVVVNPTVAEDDSIVTYGFCDDDARTLPAEQTSLSSLEYNKFYKLCPGLHQHSNGDGTILPLGQPRCGDNSNFSFFATRPASGPPTKDSQEDEDDDGETHEKIIIELGGGGACWDGNTCGLVSSNLAFPADLNSYVGMSCATLASVGMNLMCSKTIANIDLSEYNYIFIPYCTQDVHLGDATPSEYGVQHVGGHNLYRTLSWIFENFPNPQHIIITGCSAGATPLPVVYDLINRHYQNVASSSSSSSATAAGSGGGVVNKDVPIDVIADSSVFLTPKNFLDNYISNWKLDTILEKIEFEFDAVRTNFSSVAIVDHVLDRSKSTDDLVYTFHDADQTSQYFYKLMNATSTSPTLFGDDAGSSRRLRPSSTLTTAAGGYSFPMMDHHAGGIAPTNLHRGLNGDDFQSQWLSELTNGVALAGVGHSNFHVYFMNGTDHCDYSLNVPLKYNGFEAWVSTFLHDDLTASPTSVPTNKPTTAPTPTKKAPPKTKKPNSKPKKNGGK